MSFQRGKVTSITLHVEYPDGSAKDLQFDNEEIGMIAFDDQYVPAEHHAAFNVDPDEWRNNPAMLVYKPGGEEPMPFCTHNGCKPPPP